MTYCEVRFFKKDGYCVNVKEFDVLEDAIEFFNKHVEQAKVFLDLDYSDIEGFEPERVTCHGNQGDGCETTMQAHVGQHKWVAA